MITPAVVMARRYVTKQELINDLDLARWFLTVHNSFWEDFSTQRYFLYPSVDRHATQVPDLPRTQGPVEGA